MAGIPLACVSAVLKYRPYEIDRLVSRTVARRPAALAVAQGGLEDLA